MWQKMVGCSFGWIPSHVIAAAAGETFGIGVIVSAFLFGFRHGIDWDHIAAITDIAGSQDDRRSAMFFGTLYALGHALVVFLIGTAAILLGERLPESIDTVMEKVVGVTLILLGVFVFVSLARHGREFRLRSRWMLIFSGVRNAYRRIGGSPRTRTIRNRCTGTRRRRVRHDRARSRSTSPRTSLSRIGTTATTGARDTTITSIRSPTMRS